MSDINKAVKPRTILNDRRENFGQFVKLMQTTPHSDETISQDAALRSIMRLEKKSLLDMASDLTDALEKMYPDDQTTDEWLKHRYFERWTDEEEEAESCECGDFMKWEIDQPVDEFLEMIDKIRDFVQG